LPCDPRFEVLLDNPDSTPHDCKTLFAVQEALVEATGGFVFDTWSWTFPWPDQSGAPEGE
jgi:hypothetical protein